MVTFGPLKVPVARDQGTNGSGGGGALLGSWKNIDFL